MNSLTATGFSELSPKNIVCGKNIIDLSDPKVMGIVNITPDSFFDGGRYLQPRSLVSQVRRMLTQGADFIDMGAVSSRPGSSPVSLKTELNRLIPALELVLDRFPGIKISVDTFRPEVAVKAVEMGAVMINDIRGGDGDKAMFNTIADLQVPYILMHMQGTPENMQLNPEYENVVAEIMKTLDSKIYKLKELGVRDIIIDPGFGFGKTVAHNYKILKSLQAFSLMGYPVLAGISRKSMICRVLNVEPAKALNGTTALNMLALMNGASILRVHDVKEAVEVVELYKTYKRA